MTQPRNPQTTREKIDLIVNTPLTRSCKHPLAGTVDMKRVTAALREVNLPRSPHTLGPSHTALVTRSFHGDARGSVSCVAGTFFCVLQPCTPTVRLIFELMVLWSYHSEPPAIVLSLAIVFSPKIVLH